MPRNVLQFLEEPTTGTKLTDYERAARVTHGLQVVQIAQGLANLQVSREIAATEQRRAAEDKRHHDAHLNFLWSQYKETDAGQEYLAWEQAANVAMRVRMNYDRLWQMAWIATDREVNGAEPQLDLGPSNRRSLRSSCLIPALIACGWFVAAVLAAATSLEGTFVELVIGVGFWGSLAVGMIAHLRRRRQRRRARRARIGMVQAHMALLDERARRRRDRFGHEVFRVNADENGKTYYQWTLPWSEEPLYRSQSTEAFIGQAFTTYPAVDQLPWYLNLIEEPRGPEEQYPDLVESTLACFVGGDLGRAMGESTDRIEALLEDPRWGHVFS